MFCYKISAMIEVFRFDRIVGVTIRVSVGYRHTVVVGNWPTRTRVASASSSAGRAGSHEARVSHIAGPRRAASDR